MAQLIQDYLNIDFLTLTERLKTQIQKNSEFSDVDYEGSNITTIVELLAYIGELNAYYVNKLAKNQYLDTADIYENVHRITRLRGYSPKGYVSAETTLTVTLNLTAGEVSPGDTLEIPAWFTFDSSEITDDDDEIKYTTFQNTTTTVPTSATTSHSFDITLKQGTYVIKSFTGEDLVDNQLLITDRIYDYGLYPYTNPSTVVYVNGTEWDRIEDAYDDLSGLSVDQNVYKFGFDKTKRYYIEFFSSRSVPDDTDEIEVILIESLGAEGALGSGKLTTFSDQTIPQLNSSTNEIEQVSDTPFITNLTKNSTELTSKSVSITNSTSIYADDYETIDELKENSSSALYSQKRVITATDYVERLEEMTGIERANVWGEQEENPGNTQYYYKIYISVVPTVWSNDTTSTVSTSAHTWEIDDGTTQSVLQPLSYDTNFELDILEYLEPYQYINIEEYFRVPELVYFRFEIGLKVSRSYRYSAVKEVVRSKLEYYFDTSKREFGETIDFKDIHNYLLDETEISPDDDFSSVKGITNLVIRDIETFTPSLSGSEGVDYIFDYNTNGNFPMYDENSVEAFYDNRLIPIKLNKNQFPAIAEDLCSFVNEG